MSDNNNAEPRLLSRDEFLAPTERRYKFVDLPVKRGRVRIRSLTQSEKERFEATLLTPKGGMNKAKVLDSRRRLIIMCMVDMDGRLILEPDDLDSLAVLDGADIAHLHVECEKHVGFEPGEVEAIEKNSETIHGDS